MSQTKISQLELLEESSPDDLLIAVDVSDTSMAPTGTDKKLHVPAKYSINVMDNADVRAGIAAAVADLAEDPPVDPTTDPATYVGSIINQIIADNPGRKTYLPVLPEGLSYNTDVPIEVLGEGTVLEGESSGYLTSGFCTTIKMVTPGQPVIIIDGGDDGARGASVRHLKIEGCEPWTSAKRYQCVIPTGIISGVTNYLDVNGSEQDGIQIRADLVRVDDVFICGCGRDAIRLQTNNTDRSSDFGVITNVRGFQNRGSAFHCEPGNDSNANSFVGCTGNINLLWGFHDQSFLGNYYTSPKTAYNHDLASAATENDPSHPANELTVGGVKIPAGDISWTRTGNTVTLTITDWAYLMNGAYPLQAGHGVVISGTSQIDGTHLLVTASQGASTTTVTFTAPGSNVLSPQTTGKIRVANPEETFDKAVALLRADNKLTATAILGGDFCRSVALGSTVITGLYAESNLPLQLSSNTIVVGLANATGIDFEYGNPQVLWGSGSDGHITSPMTNLFSVTQSQDQTIQSFEIFGLETDQIHYHYHASVDDYYITRRDVTPSYYYFWKGNPGTTPLTSPLLSTFHLSGVSEGKTSLNSFGTEAVEFNVEWSGNCANSANGIKVGDGQGNAKWHLYPINSAPDGANIAAGGCQLWLDSTNGASKLMIKAKSANGTVVTGSVNLT